MNISLSPFAPENLVSRGGFGSHVPQQPAHLHTQAEPGAYSRDYSRVPRRPPFIYFCTRLTLTIPRGAAGGGAEPVELVGCDLILKRNAMVCDHSFWYQAERCSRDEIVGWQVILHTANRCFFCFFVFFRGGKGEGTCSYQSRGTYRRTL